MRRFIPLLLTISLALAIPSQAQSVPDVLKSFRKLEADTEAGMNYSEYSRGLAEVNAQLKTYADTNPSSPPAAIVSLRSTFELYLKARTLWDEQRLQDMRYQSGEVSIQDYFEGKRANNKEISSLWKQAGHEIDNAAALQNAKQRPKAKTTK